MLRGRSASARTCVKATVCMGAVLVVFELGDDDMVSVLQPKVAPESEELVRDAMRQCPRQAISIEE
ncbi:ferredoxin [Mycobacterium gastri]